MRPCARQTEGLIDLRRELESLEGWPEVSVDAAMLPYDVLLPLGLDLGVCERVMGTAWGCTRLRAEFERWTAKERQVRAAGSWRRGGQVVGALCVFCGLSGL